MNKSLQRSLTPVNKCTAMLNKENMNYRKIKLTPKDTKTNSRVAVSDSKNNGKLTKPHPSSLSIHQSINRQCIKEPAIAQSNMSTPDIETDVATETDAQIAIPIVMNRTLKHRRENFDETASYSEPLPRCPHCANVLSQDSLQEQLLRAFRSHSRALSLHSTVSSFDSHSLLKKTVELLDPEKGTPDRYSQLTINLST